jgi:hypothetical protein
MRKKVILFVFPLALALGSCANIHIKSGCHCPKFNSIEKAGNDKMALNHIQATNNQ